MEKYILKILLALWLVLNLVGCSGLPEHLTREAEAIPQLLEQQQQGLASHRQKFANLKQHNQWEFIQPYAEREDWSQYQKLAASKLTEAGDLYNKKIIPLLDRDKPEDSEQMRGLLKQFKSLLEASNFNAMHYSRRSEFLLNTKKQAREINNQASTDAESISMMLGQLKTRVSSLSEKYSHKSDNLKQRLQKAEQINRDSQLAQGLVSNEFTKVSSGKADYALLGDSALKLTGLLAEMTSYKKTLDGKLNELDSNYTKVLTDQRIDYFVVIGRASWCNSDGCGNGTTYRYPAVQVDAETFDYYDAITVDTIAELRSSWGRESFKLNVTAKAWGALKLDKKRQFPYGDEEADYWIEKLQVQAMHKYLLINNGEGKETDWVKVSENDFWLHQQDLGMAIESKPYGFFREDMIKTAEPVGMATIAEPTMVNGVATGSNQYGEWRQSNGHSVWHYYGMYRLFGDLLGSGRNYSYDDWSAYNQRNRNKPYYGREDEYGTYGSSTYSNARYRNSSYARRNPSDVISAGSGGRNTSRSTSSVRGAGSSNRSRGPAGGGK
jgi:hypothetical protein